MAFWNCVAMDKFKTLSVYMDVFDDEIYITYLSMHFYSESVDIFTSKLLVYILEYR